MSEWVKCEDRLPGFNKYCLVVTRDPAFILIARLCIITKGRVWEGRWEGRDDWCSFAEVTHWQELPEMPKD